MVMDQGSDRFKQALWGDPSPDKKTKRTVVISTMGAPEGKVKVTIVNMTL